MVERIFRQHDVAPVVTSSMLYRQLTADWAYTHARPTTTASVRRWARTEPQLRDFTRPGDVVDAIDAADHNRTDALLLALLRLMRAGDTLASQTLLHAMLPGLAGLAARTTVRIPPGEPDRPETARELVIVEFWQVATEYPVLRRRHRVASNLTMDTHKRAMRSLGQPAPTPFDPTPLFTDASPNADRDIYRRARNDARSAHETSLVDGIDPDADLLTVLVWAVQEQVISITDAQMLADVYLPSATDGWGFDAVAETQATSRAAIKMRCSRAVAKIAEAARTSSAASA